MAFLQIQIREHLFEFEEEEGKPNADILQVDSRFVSLPPLAGRASYPCQLCGKNTEKGYAVYKIREIAFGGGTKLSAEDGFLQFMIERLLASSAPSEEILDEEQEEMGDDMKLTSLRVSPIL